MSRNIFGSLLLLLLTSVSTQRAFADISVDLRLPVVEEALSFIESSSLSPISRAGLLRAGAIRVCGETFSRPGCSNPGLVLPDPKSQGPDAERAYRAILESALATETIRGGKAFDKAAFERYVVDGMVEALDDPASFFLAPSIYKKIASIPADFVGFGMRLVLDKDDIEIATVHEGSPAMLAGLKPGERIVRVSGKSVTGYLRPAALCSLWGADGPKVALDVKESSGAVRSVQLTYEPWRFEAFTLSRKGAVSVVQVRYFERGLEKLVANALADPESKGIVFDLRGSGSGDEATVVAVADLLLGEATLGGKRTRLDIGSRTWKTISGSPGERVDVPVAVVIDGRTAGLSEWLSAALKQAGRAILVGQKTSGRLTLETLRPLSDGSAVQVTSMELTGPDGLDLSQGVTPKVRSVRPDVLELALSIIETSSGPALPQLVETAGKLVAERARSADSEPTQK